MLAAALRRLRDYEERGEEVKVQTEAQEGGTRPAAGI